MTKKLWIYGICATAFLIVIAVLYSVGVSKIGSVTYSKFVEPVTEIVNVVTKEEEEVIPKWPASLDTTEYDRRVLALAGYVPPATTTIVIAATATISTSTKIHVPPSPLVYSSSTNITVSGKRWPSGAVYPQGDAIVPFKRILAYYGNFYSRNMGILGEYEHEEVLRRLASTQADWEAVDPDTPVLPAIEYIAMVAQADAGVDGMYRAVMPDTEVEKAYKLAQSIQGILILDIQVGLSPIEREMPKFKDFLSRPDVHFAIDPEFSMKTGKKPGTVIGTFDATDINYVITYMSEIVRENKLPPKVLLVHRFTSDMVTNSAKIKPTPEVQVIMIMDGWGSKDLKRGTYSHVIEPEPVQFTGIKLFYKNDLKPPSTGLLTPQEVLSLHPKPIYVQYQ